MGRRHLTPGDRQSSSDVSARLEEVFRAVFSLGDDVDVRQIRQISFRHWDSLGHVLLMSAIESEFERSIEVEVSIGLTSFESILIFLDGDGT